MKELYKTKLPINNFIIWAIQMKPYIKKHYNHLSIEDKKNILRKIWSTISNSQKQLYTKKAIQLRYQHIFYKTLIEYKEKYNITHPMLEETQPILEATQPMLEETHPILLPPIIINDVRLYNYKDDAFKITLDIIFPVK